MIKASNVSFGYLSEPLYKDVTFTIGKGQKVGLVGPNGSGKSTLLKIIRGLENIKSGNIDIQGTIAYVPQEVKSDITIEKSISVKNYCDPEDSLEGHEIQKIFSGLELDVSLRQDPKSLSGGQKTKLAIARAIISNPDILLLDEPTNFMDVQGTKWVMDFLSIYSGTVICISHDLRLMDKSIDKILAVEPNLKKIDEYKGNYSQYLILKKQKEEELNKRILVQEKKIKSMSEGLKKMARFTSKKGVKARIRQQKRIEKLKENLPEAPKELKTINVKLPEPKKVGELPIQANGIEKSYGEKQVLKNVNFVIKRGEKIALLGPNGVGKSTFIKILMGLIEPDSGKVIKHPELSVGYYSQEFENFKLEERVVDVFTDKVKCSDEFARTFLGKYLISNEKTYQTVESLSGGEKTRLSIAILTAASHNLLILDEPTTYLDPLSQRIILESIKEYKGALLLVSHTPEFVKEIKPDYALLFPEEKLSFWRDEYTNRVSDY